MGAVLCQKKSNSYSRNKPLLEQQGCGWVPLAGVSKLQLDRAAGNLNKAPSLPTRSCIFWGPSHLRLLCGCVLAAEGHTHCFVFQADFQFLSAQLCSQRFRSNPGERRQQVPACRRSTQNLPLCPTWWLLLAAGMSQQYPLCSFDSFDLWGVILRFQEILPQLQVLLHDLDDVPQVFGACYDYAALDSENWHGCSQNYNQFPQKEHWGIPNI